MDINVTYQQYVNGIDYKQQVKLYSIVDENERFYAGDQWRGIKSEGLPQPVFNFIRYATAWKIAAVTDRAIDMDYFVEGTTKDVQKDIDNKALAKQLRGQAKNDWERLKMDFLNHEGLKQSAITGDYILYFWWDKDIKTGQKHQGNFNVKLVDNVNYIPANPNSPDVQSQQYIILVTRDMVVDIKEEAKKNGIKENERNLIVADDETQYTSGDKGKIELEGKDEGKANVFLKLYMKDGVVWTEKSTSTAWVQKPKASKNTRYPIAMMNWDTRKNSCHGTAEVTGLIPNQVYLNKIMAFAQLYQLQTSFPKVLFDTTRIEQWTNKVAGAIGVNGDITNAARYLDPPNTAFEVFRGFDTTLETTMRMMGATDAVMGNITNPDNTSAFIATRDAALVPLQAQQERFYNMVEDIGLIWYDFYANYYGNRMIFVEKDDNTGAFVQLKIPKDAPLNLKIEVGAAATWSEVNTVQTLDKLLQGQVISPAQYLRRMPEGYIPEKETLIEEVEATQQAAEQEGAEAGGLPQGF